MTVHPVETDGTILWVTSSPPTRRHSKQHHAKQHHKLKDKEMSRTKSSRRLIACVPPIARSAFYQEADNEGRQDPRDRTMNSTTPTHIIAQSRSTASRSSIARPDPHDAPVVLLLHGFPTSSHMFRNLIPALADRYHVIAPDYPGYGQSDMPDRAKFAYTFDHFARARRWPARSARRRALRHVRHGLRRAGRLAAGAEAPRAGHRA